MKIFMCVGENRDENTNKRTERDCLLRYMLMLCVNIAIADYSEEERESSRESCILLGLKLNH